MWLPRGYQTRMLPSGSLPEVLRTRRSGKSDRCVVRGWNRWCSRGFDSEAYSWHSPPCAAKSPAESGKVLKKKLRKGLKRAPVARLRTSQVTGGHRFRDESLVGYDPPCPSEECSGSWAEDYRRPGVSSLRRHPALRARAVLPRRAP